MSFDFERFRRDLAGAAKKALAEARREHPGETICAFALYSDDGAMTVCPAIDFASAREGRLSESPDHAADMKFATAEWALEAFGADVAFDKLSKRLAAHLAAHPRGFARFRRTLFETCVDALATLRDNKVVRGDCMLVFTVSDGTPMPRRDGAWFARLNPGLQAEVKAYRAWLRLADSHGG